MQNKGRKQVNVFHVEANVNRYTIHQYTRRKKTIEIQITQTKRDWKVKSQMNKV